MGSTVTGPFRKPRRQDLGPRHAALVDALRVLIERAGVTLDELGTAVRHRLGQAVPVRPGQRISALADGSRFPTSAELAAIVALCTGGAPAQVEQFRLLHSNAGKERRARRTAGARVVDGTAADGAGSVARVGDARDWTRWGVHPPITQLADGTDLTTRVREGHLPTYVLREADRLQLRPVLRAADAGEYPPVRLVVICGESSAGKTRMAVEAARDLLPHWRLVLPRTTDDVMALTAGPGLGAQVVVWLDEAQELLVQPAATEALQKLRDVAVGPVVLLATLRTDAERALEGSAGWRLLDRAEHRIELQRRPHDPAELKRELDRAAELDDPWIREALTKIGDRYGIAEWLAAGPQLQRALGRARTSSDPVERTAAAIVDAATDCYRAGYTTPVPEPLLRAAQHLYQPPTDHLDPTAFAAALEWARRRISGAVGLLIHHRGRGDLPFDYLLGHADRPGAPAINTRLWPLLLERVTARTSRSIGLAAHRHGQPEITRELVRRRLDAELLTVLGDENGLARAADAGDEYAARRLVDLLGERGNQAALTERADAGDRYAAERLALLLANRGDRAALTERAGAGDRYAAERLALLLAERGDQAALTERAAAGDEYAARRLAVLLAERGDQAALEARVAAGDEYAARLLAVLLGERGDQAALEARVAAGDEYAARLLAVLLGERGDQAALEARVAAGDEYAAERLAGLLAERGDQAALTERADAGDEYAVGLLAGLLGERGDQAALTERAAAGDEYAARRLAGLLAERGDQAALTERADAGDEYAVGLLAVLLGERGDQAALTERAAAGDEYAARLLAGLLAERGDQAALTERADAGDRYAVGLLADLLAERGDQAALEARAAAGDEYAARLLAGLLAERGDQAALEARAAAGDEYAARLLAGLLAERGDQAALAARADAGDESAANWMANLPGPQAADVD